MITSLSLIVWVMLVFTSICLFGIALIQQKEKYKKLDLLLRIGSIVFSLTCFVIACFVKNNF